MQVCLADGKPSESAGENPFTAKASLIRYWNRQISNDLPKPPFLLSKASPLSAVDSAVLCKLASQNALSSHLSSFCSAAKLFCAFDSDSDSELSSGRTQANDANFAVYSNRGFANYGGSRIGGVDSFKNYSDGLNMPNGSFRKYSGESKRHREVFTSYARDGNIATGSFAGYGTGASGGSGEFATYDPEVNVPHREFTTYDSNGDNHKLSFSAYAGDTNSGAESFTSYGKNGKNVPAEFTNYGDGSNIIGSTFTAYGQLANAQNDSFKGYGHSSNNPQNNFKSYSLGGNAAADTFTNYRDGANVGDDSFNSYARSSTAAKVNFANYGRTFNVGNDTFKEYGKGSTKSSVDFKNYGLNYTFKDYEKKGATFAQYSHASGSSRRNGTGSDTASGISVNRWVEPGKFFRESMLKKGNVMAMPDIHDRMPGRSFLPRAIVSKLPFSSSRLQELKDIFHARDNSTTERVIKNALEECERGPSRGETKRCVGSLEDMIDFAVAVLGRDVVVRTTETARGSKERVMIGEVRGINGGKVTRSVSCHQSLYPYLLYYCHSVPKVRVYDVDIYDVAGKEKMNHGVAICHIDTSSWGPTHGAFVALGSSPGLIEVCHWIFENDMTWTISDSDSH